MKNICFLIIIIMIAGMSLTAAAQGKYTKPVDTTVEEQQPRRGLFDKDKTPVDKKYLEGACPMVGNKIVWKKYFYADDKTAKEIYDTILPFLQKMAKEEGQTEKSNVSVVNEEEYQIGAHFVEKMVFQNTALVLDQAEFSYHLLVYCIDGRCEVVLKNMSYIYEADRDGGGVFPAEDMISDDNALNKKKDGFHKGGFKKFRMKTIDRKDEIFRNIANALKK